MALNMGLAKIRARKFWGKRARIEDKSYASEGRRVFRVGIFQEKPLPMFLIYGEGSSWEEAFAAAAAAGYCKLKVADVVMIYKDPITRRDPEGYAVLVDNLGTVGVHKGNRVERWTVRFRGEDMKFSRDILIDS